jgi:hypothetical protein
MKSSPVDLIGLGGSTVQVDDPIGEIPIKANTVEGFFGITKRGLICTIQHALAQHLQRYVNQFDCRYSIRSAFGFNNVDHSLVTLKGIAGKRPIHSHSPRQANILRL